jgi:hypothetical protein
MTLLQGRKSKRGLTSVWDMVVRSVTGSGGVRSGVIGPELSNKLENPGWYPGSFHFWKRHGWRFYPVNTYYFIPASNRPSTGFSITVLAVDPASQAGEWLLPATKICQDGSVVIAVELPNPDGPIHRQAENFMEAGWTAIAFKIGGLAGTPIRLTWWGTGEAAPVVEQATRLSGHKYYLRPDRVVTGTLEEPGPGQTGETAKVAVLLAKAS